MSSENIYRELAEAVREHPVIYDKNKKGHRDKDFVKSSWEKVAKQCGLESEEACRLFNNLKRRYNKARNDALDNAKGRVVSAYRKMKLDDMAYLSWLKPYLHVRKIKSIVPSISIPSPMSSIHESSDDDDDDDESDNERKKSETSTTTEDTLPDTTRDIKCEKPIEERQVPSVEVKTEEAVGIPLKKQWKAPDMSSFDNETKWPPEERGNDMPLAPGYPKASERTWSRINQESNCSNDAFGMYISCELKQLDWRQQRMAKNEIQNILFKIQMQDCDN